MSKLITNTIEPQSGDTVTISNKLNVQGLLTYEDVTNVDSIGIITARGGMVSEGTINITGVNNGVVSAGVVTATTFDGSGASLTNLPSGQLTGALPAIDGSALTNLPGGTSDNISEGNTKAEVVDTGSNGHFLVETEGTERLRIDATGDILAKTIDARIGSDVGAIEYGTSADNSVRFYQNNTEYLRIDSGGAFGLSGSNYGSNGQVLTSSGSGSAPTWTTVSGGGGGGSSDKIEEGDTKAEVVDTGSDGHFLVETEGTERLRIDADGLCLIGSGGSTVYANANADDLVVGNISSGKRSGITIVGATNQDARLAFSKGTSYFDALIGYIVYGFSDNRLGFYVNMSEALAIDANGRQLIGFNGLTSQVSEAKIQVFAGDSSNHIAIINSAASDSDGARSGVLRFHGKNSGNSLKTLAFIEASHDGSANDEKGRLVFKTNDGSDGDAPTERLRLESGGQVNVFADSTVHIARSGTSAGTVQWLYAGAHSASDTNSGTVSFQVYTNGNVQNTNNSYGVISDVSLKENIVDANSQWADIKAVKVRNFNFKEGQTHKQIGVVAQELETVSPGLVYENRDNLKGVNTSVLYMKALGALQEAMARIETLESEVTALKG